MDVSNSPFAPLAGFPVGIASFAVEWNICAIAAGIKRYKSIIKKERKKHKDIMLLVKIKRNTIKVFISKALID